MKFPGIIMYNLARKWRTIFWSLFCKIKKFKSVDKLVDSHFKIWSEPNHINRKGLEIALNKVFDPNPVILETGTSAYGTDSSRLFDSFARNFNGYFYSVDINEAPSKRLVNAKSKCTKFFVMDSVDFLKKFTILTGHKKADLIYLDSWDVDWNNPYPSARHGKNEIETIKSYIKPGTILIIDDTPNSLEWIPRESRKIALEFMETYGVLPGKGAFFKSALEGIRYETLHHAYNIVLRFN